MTANMKFLKILSVTLFLFSGVFLSFTTNDTKAETPMSKSLVVQGGEVCEDSELSYGVIYTVYFDSSMTEAQVGQLAASYLLGINGFSLWRDMSDVNDPEYPYRQVWEFQGARPGTHIGSGGTTDPRISFRDEDPD